MNGTIDTALDQFNATLDQFLAAWDEAIRTGDLSRVKAYTAEIYNGTVAHSHDDKAEFYDREECFTGLPSLLAYVGNSRQIVENRHVRMRTASEAVASFDQVYERDGKVFLCFVITQTWRKIDETWLLVREGQEVLGA